MVRLSVPSHARLVALLLAPFLAAVLTALVIAQDKKIENPKTDPPTKARGFLPANFKALGLSADQVQAIYKIQEKHNAEEAKLKAQLEKLKAEEKAEIEKVLTEDQKKKLKEIRSGEKPTEKDKPAKDK